MSPPLSSPLSSTRQRATAILVRNNKVLLVRDRTRTSFSLPGGGIEANELAISAVAREVHEETALVPSTIAYLFQHGGKHNNHHVFRIQADGEVSVDGDAEVEEFLWWDRAQDVSVYPHVLEILGQFGEVT